MGHGEREREEGGRERREGETGERGGRERRERRERGREEVNGEGDWVDYDKRGEESARGSETYA